MRVAEYAVCERRHLADNVRNWIHCTMQNPDVYPCDIPVTLSLDLWILPLDKIYKVETINKVVIMT